MRGAEKFAKIHSKLKSRGVNPMKLKQRHAGICVVLLLLILSPAGAKAARVKVFNLAAEVPETWRVKDSDEQVIIYNKTEDAAVIVDRVEEDAEKTAQTVAEDLAGAVGVEKKDIRSDRAGGLSMDFTHNGEPVNVRVFENDGRVLMVYAFGSDAEVREIASSVGSPESGPKTEGEKDEK